MDEKINKMKRPDGKYEAPRIRSYSSKELLDRIGPAQGISSGAPGTGRGGSPIDEVAGKNSGGSFSR